MNNQITPISPLFCDPIYDGAADPTVIWNQKEHSWWMFYTNRRASAINHHVSYAHGTDIGIASSKDNGRTWIYRGIAQNLEFEAGRNTFWAPEVIFADNQYHMYCSYIEGIPSQWTGNATIVHYTSNNLWDWVYEGVLNLSSNRVIDACVHEINPGIYKMWYKDERNSSYIYSALSTDLYKWAVLGPEITDQPQEGPNVFIFKNHKWMITDPWNGLDVYETDDYSHWTKTNTILKTPGKRLMDGYQASHADVLVCKDNAYIFYFLHPHINDQIRFSPSFVWEYEHRRTVIQVAKLEFNGTTLICHRDQEFNMNLIPPSSK